MKLDWREIKDRKKHGWPLKPKLRDVVYVCGDERLGYSRHGLLVLVDKKEGQHEVSVSEALDWLTEVHQLGARGMFKSKESDPEVLGRFVQDVAYEISFLRGNRDYWKEQATRKRKR